MWRDADFLRGWKDGVRVSFAGRFGRGDSGRSKEEDRFKEW